MAKTPEQHLARVRTRVERRDRAEQALADANQALAEAVEAAIAERVSVNAVATAAGVSRQRAWQLANRVRQARTETPA